MKLPWSTFEEEEVPTPPELQISEGGCSYKVPAGLEARPESGKSTNNSQPSCTTPQSSGSPEPCLVLHAWVEPPFPLSNSSSTCVQPPFLQEQQQQQHSKDLPQVNREVLAYEEYHRAQRAACRKKAIEEAAKTELVRQAVNREAAVILR